MITGSTGLFNSIKVNGNTTLSNSSFSIVYDPSTITSNQTYTLMPIQGISGSVMENNGLGNLTWKPKSQYAIMKDEKALGTAGGTFAAGSWVTRTLNVIDTNIPTVSFTGTNQFILPAGKYKVEINCPAINSGNHQAKILNVTDNIDVLFGNACPNSTARTNSTIVGSFIVASSKVFAIQHRCSAGSVSTSALGSAGSFGTEVYTQVEISTIY